MPKVKNKKMKTSTKLPKLVRDELQMTCALQDYSKMEQGKGKSLTQQHGFMHIFFHGKDPTHLSQIKLLCDGVGCYNQLFEEALYTAKSKTSTLKGLNSIFVKEKLTKDPHRKYVTQDIFVSDLEKKNITGKQLVAGYTLLSMAKKGISMFCKANSFAAQKWDTENNCAKNQGETLDDVIEFVYKSMYILLHVNQEGISNKKPNK